MISSSEKFKIFILGPVLCVQLKKSLFEKSEKMNSKVLD